MANEMSRSVSELFEDGAPIDAAIKAAVREAALQHKQKGLPLAVWRDERVVWIPPEEIVLGPESSSETV